MMFLVVESNLKVMYNSISWYKTSSWILSCFSNDLANKLKPWRHHWDNFVINKMSSQRHHQVFDAECFVYSIIYKSQIKELQRNSDPSDYTQDVSFNVLPAEMIRNLEDAYPVLTRSRMFYKFVRIIFLTNMIIWMLKNLSQTKE